MILNKHLILEAVRKNDISIDPFFEENFKDASYTFTLDRKIKTLAETATLKLDAVSYQEHTISEDGFVLLPQQFVVGYTREKLSLHGKYACMLSARGSVAQKGLAVLLTDTFCEPDTDGQIAIAIHNVSNLPVELKAGLKIVKGIFLPVGRE
ncbi:MAG TPA: hypothetical protein VFM02_03315 [Candidatus Paceibacterota bacterium]|nr:hypothetical protein [Candidatus Paceibacterota bacterium]